MSFECDESPIVFADFLQILNRPTHLLTDCAIREEVFSVKRMEIYAAHLAQIFTVSHTPKCSRYILPGLKKNGRQLLAAYKHLTESLREKEVISPAAEWFVDNFHIIEDQLREIKQDLPKSYYDELPKLSTGELEGYPRVYAIALAIIAHTDSRLDTETLKHFLDSYQKVSPLTIGELWATAITLRIALVEHLTPLALRIVKARQKRTEADVFAEKLLNMTVASVTSHEDIVKEFKAGVGEPKDYDRAFIVQLTQRLRDQDPDLMPAFEWLEKQLEHYHHTNIQTVIQLEHNRQATAQATVGNIITSMRLLSSIDWREFIESVSLVDPILHKDPAGAYTKMDFTTRDRYRRQIERLAKRSTYTELEVADKLLEVAESHVHPETPKKSHIGYYLIGDGRYDFEKLLGFKSPLKDQISQTVLSHPTLIYLGTFSLITLLLLFPVFYYFTTWGGQVVPLLLFLVLALVPVSELALSILNHTFTMLLKPKVLPKIDTTIGIPENAMTMVVIPTLFTNESVIDDLLEKMEVQYLSNRDPHIYFALLGDFADADLETFPEDVILLAKAQMGISALNKKYVNRNAKDRFYLFHRKRLFNPSEEKWMGYERKRGKIHEFNELLRGAKNTSFISPTPTPDFLSKIRFVITLDSDTELPRGSAHDLIGIAIHPLNLPEFDSKKERVVSGYGILQPRISIALLSANRTRFAHLFSGARGLDPYTTACSDVYQDLFSEGSYTGKGLYHVDAFEAALSKRTPENTVLSHDLFEGCFARSALVTNVELFDDYPTDYEIYSKRQHRWIRGDWQIAPWLFPKIPNSELNPSQNPLPLIAKWKILDNLRRSLVPVTAMLWLWLGWFILPGNPLFWTFVIGLAFVFPIYATITSNIFHNRQGVSWRRHVSYRWDETLMQTEQILVMLAFLPNQALNHLDAIIRTFYRKFVSHKKLLEWVSFSDVQNKNCAPLWQKTLPGPLFSLTTAFALYFLRQDATIITAPFLFLWLTNPFLADWIGKKIKPRERPLTANEIATYRTYARRTWHFFETFLSKEDNFLAPDNFQEEPEKVIAHRTSPTNIGIQLLSLSSAYDFGYIGKLEFLERAEQTFQTLRKLERLHGHFYNWYDTQTLLPLRPQYISTVDSGNLAGHLLALKRSFFELTEDTYDSGKIKSGLTDTLNILKSEAKLEDNNLPIDPILEFISSSKTDSIVEYNLFLDELKSQLLKILSILPSSPISRTNIWLNTALHQVEEFLRDISHSTSLHKRIQNLIDDCDKIALGMDFKFLFDEERQIFVIGFNVLEQKKDNSYYDLLASESRLTSFVAIAKGDVPQEHWFRLGRQLTAVKGGRALISWTGTMFEYLMPLLVTRDFDETLLNQTYRTIVARQIDYGEKNNVPWGVSESEYNIRDLQKMFQYRAFGIPGLGLKRGLCDDLVISPYSSMLAAAIDPIAVLSNLKRLEEMGALSHYGFYEALDFTPERLKKDEPFFILRAFMAHHQGMSLIAINNALNGNIMQSRFHSEPLVQATQLLLQERIPISVPLYHPRSEEVHYSGTRDSGHWNPRIYSDVHLDNPRTQLLSNGTYSLMLTVAGSGYSRSQLTSVNRWHEDATLDHWGQFFYIRDRATNKIWSSGYQPTQVPAKKYEVTFADDKIEFYRKDGETTTHTEVIVAPEENVEIRRISLTNNSSETQEIELTSFMEIVLAPEKQDRAHPAFSNLFIQTEFLPNESALLSTRRPRSETEKALWAFHLLITEGKTIGPVQYETDRSKFLGRGRNPSDALVITEDLPLSNTVGNVLDPIFSLRQSVRIPAGETVRVSFATGVTESREEALRIVDKYHDVHIFNREAELAWTATRVQQRHLNIDSAQAHTFQRLASRVIYLNPSMRSRPHVLEMSSQTQSGLWTYGISGDLPIILACIRNEEDMEMVRELLHGHEYLRLKGLAIDLVLLNERATSYLQTVEEELIRQIRMIGSQTLLDKPGGIFIRRADIMPQKDIILLKAVARVVLNASQGTLKEQLKRHPLEEALPSQFLPVATAKSYSKASPTVEPLKFFNGLGGFQASGREYVITLQEGKTTPLPWINVISNAKDFGFLISESGGGYTWSMNSQENRLTPWSNDAMSDPLGEIIYIRDEKTGEIWCPTPSPIRENDSYVIRHGQGYSQFEYNGHGISTTLQMFVPLDASVKISSLRLKNTGREKRSLSVTSFVEWVLGVNREVTAPHVTTTFDKNQGILFARNPYNNEFHDRVAFSFMSGHIDSYTCDRKEFLGRNGSYSHPSALSRTNLSGHTGAGLDPSSVFQKKIDLAPGEECEVVLLLGQGENVEEVRGLVEHYSLSVNQRTAFNAVLAHWDEVLGAIEIKTPDPAMDMLTNRWLLYQTLSCRIWGRSAFYQSGGAFGFRDQLQDVMALLYTKPEIARKQILLSAKHQFVEGDVLHWWHPPSGRGVRTHISDDLLWLAFVTSFYLKVTKDESILFELVPFLEAPLLDPKLESTYLLPLVSNEKGTLLEHCVRALDKSLKTGQHGLPLMGSGDWNDGMNRVGSEGKGESVWLAWFLYSTLEQFIPLLGRSDLTRIHLYEEHKRKLKQALSENGWDGDWYRRAFFDDGTAIGSRSNQECQIDSITQSWAVLSKASTSEEERARAFKAMLAVDEKLVSRSDKLIKLFSPPFDKISKDPGYIRGYIPGVRENGGQYTHAALWTVMAFASLGESDKACELFGLLNPINHSSTIAQIEKYKVEPYVVAADVYSVAPHIGRGGWTWYTGSASWMYRTVLESLLGFKLNGNLLKITPCIPKTWKGFQLTYKRGTTRFSINFNNNAENNSFENYKIELDGVKLTSHEILLTEDGKVHEINITA